MNTRHCEAPDGGGARLAYELAAILTNSNVKKDLLWKEYKAEITAARRANALARPAQFPLEDRWLAVRR